MCKPAVSNMAEEKKMKNLCAKISKNSQDTVHLESLKVSQTVHKLLLDDLRKKKHLDKDLRRIKDKKRKCAETKGQGKPPSMMPAKRINLE